MSGFLTIGTCPSIPQDKADISYGSMQLKIDNQQSVLVLEKPSINHYLMKIKFEPIWDSLCFNLIICKDNAKIPKTFQEIQ